MIRKTKIVCTLGPASDSEEMISKLMDAGMNVCRLNMSHGSYEEQGARIDRIKRLRAEKNIPVAIMLDTKGPEVRTKTLKGDKVTLQAGQDFILTSRDIEGDETQVSITYPKMVDLVHAGTRVLIDDGLIALDVKQIVNGTDIVCTVINGGVLGGRKGISVPDVDLQMPSIGEKDRSDIIFGIEKGIDLIAASFVCRPSDVLTIRKLCADNGGSHVQIFSKIENRMGVNNFDEILKVSDGIMVARGDLGVELPAEAIPNTQRRIVEKCICAKRPVIIATQMLYSMVKSPRPTRAEVSDVASAIYERVDAVMLSDETAMGDFPVESVETMARIAREIERDETHFKPMIDMDMVSVNHEITAQLARSAVRASTNLPIKYVVLDTKTGRTGRYLAAFRGQKTVMAVCYQLHAQRILALSYGVVPILRNQELKDRYHFLIDALEVIEQHQKLDGQDLLAIVGGSFGPDGGASYVEIANVLNIRRRNEEIVAAQKS